MKRVIAIALISLAGCATTEKVWMKDGADEQLFSSEAGQCKAQAFSVPGAMANTMQVAVVYNSCMQGKGWTLTERDRR